MIRRHGGRPVSAKRRARARRLWRERGEPGHWMPDIYRIPFTNSVTLIGGDRIVAIAGADGRMRHVTEHYLVPPHRTTTP